MQIRRVYQWRHQISQRSAHATCRRHSVLHTTESSQFTDNDEWILRRRSSLFLAEWNCTLPRQVWRNCRRLGTGAWHRREGEIKSVRLSGVVIHSNFRNRGIIYNRQNYVFETHVVIRTPQRIRNLITTDEAKSVVTAVLFLKVRLLKLAVVPHVWCEHSEISARSELTCSSCHWFDLTFVHNTDPCLPPLTAERSAHPLLCRADNMFKTQVTGRPAYLYDLIQPNRPARQLRSSQHFELHDSGFKTVCESRDLRDAAPPIWNSTKVTDLVNVSFCL